MCEDLLIQSANIAHAVAKYILPVPMFAPNIFLLDGRNHRNPTGIIREINFPLNSFQKQGFIDGETTGAFTNEICNTSLL